ncbi:MAG: hypothetical protein JEZ02_01035 [Desulfatibacillum sp.]|nr:hypothetical protein [Desulfatibacillum sp.]
MTKKSITLATIITLVLASLAFAGDFRSGNYQRSGESTQNRPPQNAGFLLGQCFHDAMALEVLSELTGKDAADLGTGNGTDMREVLEDAGIDKEAFRVAMDAKTLVVAQQAVDCGLITQEQADTLAEKMENLPQSRGKRMDGQNQAQ